MKFGTGHIDKPMKTFQAESSEPPDSTGEHAQIREILRRFQEGYDARDIQKAGAFADDLFLSGEDACVLGTSTGELFCGSGEIKRLVEEDWQYWGDVKIDRHSARISVEGGTAWFAAAGSVKYAFEDTPERYDRYLEFIKKKAEETGLTPGQKIAFINWVLALTYHQREGKKREYLWPLHLSGVLIKAAGKWRFAQLHFSIPRADFPDERFENSGEYLENYNKQNATAGKYKNNRMNDELKSLLKNLETKFAGWKGIPGEPADRLFMETGAPFIIGPVNQWHGGVDRVREFFAANGGPTLSLDLEHAIASKSGEISWVTVTGILKQKLAEDEAAAGALEELSHILQADLDSREKIFAAHRSVAYALKESASGENYTCPLRLTAVISSRGGETAFRHMHFSFPFYWNIEGRVDGI